MRVKKQYNSAIKKFPNGSFQKKVRKLNYYVWIVWNGRKLAGYINAYGEWEAMRKAKEKFGQTVFVERTVWLGAQELPEQS